MGQGAQIIQSDICVYGGTSGGVSAAVAAARLGKNVVLVTHDNHVGGMSASGLGVTDIGGTNTAYIGGIAAEFYSRVGRAYGSTSPVYWFEPHVAEQTFWQMLSQAGVPVYTNQLLASVTKSGQVMTQITMTDGTSYQAREFIDTSYEGDLMAQAGVPFTVGREGTSAYGESFAGVETPGGSYNYDPYVITGNPSSGLLPLVQSGSADTVGQADNKVQTYNFRLCLTQNLTNMIPIAPPANYSESQYELVRRYIAARVAANGSVHLNQVIDIQTIIPNGKTDINARDELSTDYIGYNYTYPTNTYAGRQAIWQAHADYIRGLLYFYATSTNVPANLQHRGAVLGPRRGRIPGHWRLAAPDVCARSPAHGQRLRHAAAGRAGPACRARSHRAGQLPARLAPGGAAGGRRLSRWEGGAISGTPPYPFGISYRSIIPGTNQCQNLFCTFALSASHVGFAPVRMEPVFMMTSQSAGTAAAFAIDDNVPVQQLSYQKLSAQLRADGQVLTWPAAIGNTNGIILDQGGTGHDLLHRHLRLVHRGQRGGLEWRLLARRQHRQRQQVDHLHTHVARQRHLRSGRLVGPNPNRATNTPYYILHAAGTTRVLVNQQNASGGWFKLLTTNFNAGTGSSVTISNGGTSGYVIADGVRWLPVGSTAPPPPPPVVDFVASDAVACEFGTNTARFSIVRSGDTNLLP